MSRSQPSEQEEPGVAGAKRSFLIVAVVLTVAAYYAWWIFLSGDNFRRHSANAGNRQALVRLHAALDVGADREKVLNEYWSLRTTELRLRVDAADRWIVSMPYEFGARDWTLIVEFREGRVSAVRVRTSDGPAPTNGPPDKAAP